VHLRIQHSCRRWHSRCEPSPYSRLLLIAVDGLHVYLNVFRDAFRTGIPRLAGQIGRMTLVAWPNIGIVQVVKSKIARTWNIQRIVVQGTKAMVEQLLQTSQEVVLSILPTANGSMPPSASAWLACSVAIGISLAMSPSMYILGCVYNNFCDCHKSLRLSFGRHGFHWVPRTPALAAGLADHR
jgi:hypothetical protein